MISVGSAAGLWVINVNCLPKLSVSTQKQERGAQRGGEGKAVTVFLSECLQPNKTYRAEIDLNNVDKVK